MSVLATDVEVLDVGNAGHGKCNAGGGLIFDFLISLFSFIITIIIITIPYTNGLGHVVLLVPDT